MSIKHPCVSQCHLKRRLSHILVLIINQLNFLKTTDCLESFRYRIHIIIVMKIIMTSKIINLLAIIAIAMLTSGCAGIALLGVGATTS